MSQRPYYSTLGKELCVRFAIGDLTAADRMWLLRDLLRSFVPEDPYEAKEFAERADALLDGIEAKEET